MSEAPKILAAHSDRQVLKRVIRLLNLRDLEVDPVMESTRVVARALEWKPRLILVDRHMPAMTGGEVIRALKGFEESASIPVAFFTDDCSHAEAMRGLRSGAVDILRVPFEDSGADRVARLLRELADRRHLSDEHEQLVQNLLAYYRREGHSGAVVVNPGTPFEGRACFNDGELVSAQYGPVNGREALSEMLYIEEGVWRFELDDTAPFPLPRHHTPSAPIPALDSIMVEVPQATVLFVDDDADTRELVSLQLSRAGFHVETAADGHAGFRLAQEGVFDLVVADLNMPKLDGWGMLRLIKADHHTRELPVVFLSAQDDYRETLRAARAGAHDYLSKTGRAEALVESVRAILRPRHDADQDLAGGKPLTGELSLLGPRWLLKTLERHRCTGRLEAVDEWGRYIVDFEDGLLTDARSSAGIRQSTGAPAIAALLVARGAIATFRHCEPGQSARGAWGRPSEAVHRTCDTLNQIEATLTAHRLAVATRFTVDPELYALFLRVANDTQVALARAVCERHVHPGELAAELLLAPEQVEDGLKEMLRRKVISFARHSATEEVGGGAP